MKNIKGSTIDRIKYVMELVVYALLIITFTYWMVTSFTDWILEQNELLKAKESGIIEQGDKEPKKTLIIPKNIGDAFQ